MRRAVRKKAEIAQNHFYIERTTYNDALYCMSNSVTFINVLIISFFSLKMEQFRAYQIAWARDA